MRTSGFLRVLAVLLVLGLPATGTAQGVLTNGGNHNGTIAVPFEVDVWTFTADQNDAIVLSIGEVARDPDSGFWPWIRVTGPTGATLVCGNCWGDRVAQMQAVAPLSGTYTVQVSSADSGNDAVGDYVLTLARSPGSFLLGDEGGPMTNGAIHEGRIEVGDLDMWSFTADQGDAILLNIGEVPVGPGTPDPGFWPWIRLFGPNGAVVVCGNCWGDHAAQMQAVAPLTGTYTVVVATADSGNDATGDYRLTLARAPGSFSVDQGDHGGALANGVNHTGRIEVGDFDMWTFTANQGDAVLLNIGEVPVGPGVPDPGFWPWIRVFGPNGTVLVCGNCWGDRAAQMQAVAPLTGSYTVVVSTADSGRDATGDYRLTLARAPGVFTVDQNDQGGALTNGSNHSGRIEVGDLDMWSFTANQGDAILLNIGEVPVGPGTPDPGFWPWIRVFGPGGAVLVCGNCWGDLAAQMQAVAPLAGTYTVVVSTADSSNDATGDYRLTLARVPGAYSVDVGDQGGAMVNNTDHVGRVEIGDLDMWSFTANQGAALTVTIAEIPVGPGVPDPGFWPWIRILGPTGATVLCGNCWGDTGTQVSTTAPLSGTYTIIVSTADSSRDATGDYRLRVVGASPPPTSVNDSYSTAFNTPLVVPAPGVLGNDSNVAGASVAVVAGVGTGTLSLSTNGGFTYTPPVGFSGVTSFTYRATTAAGAGNVATVSITVHPATPGPTAQSDSYGTLRDQVLTVAAPGVLANDTSPGGAALSAVLGTPTAHGGLALNANGSFTYTPNAGFTGTDSFTYRASNANGLSNLATVSIAVTAVTTVQAPTNLYAWSIVGNVVTLRWTAPTTGPTPTGYILDGGIAPGAPLVSLATGRLEPIFVFAVPNGAFYLRIRAVAGAQTSTPSNEIRIHVNQPVAPSAPAGLTGMVSGQAVALAWRNTYAGGTPQNVILDVSGTLSASLPLGPAESFTFNGVPGGVYTFSVRAANASGVSPASNPVTLSFPQQCSGAPSVPANFLAFKTGSILTAIWDPASTGQAPTHFMLHVSGAVNASVPFASHGLNVPVPPGSYTLSVSAVNACGASAATAPITVTFP